MALQSIKTSPEFNSNNDNTRYALERIVNNDDQDNDDISDDDVDGLAPLNPSSPSKERSLSGKSHSAFTDYHRDLGDGGFRGAIFGFSDGLATNVCLVIGVQVALGVTSAYHIIMTGIAGLLAGAFSMGCGEYISMKAQSEAMVNEINRERDHLKYHWQSEMEGLRSTLKQELNLEEETLNKIIDDLSRSYNNNQNKNEHVLTFHAKMEMGIDPNDQGSPWKAAIYSFVCFSFGAFIPLIPYFIFKDNNISYKISIALSILISIGLGWGLGKLNGVYPLNTTLRQVGAICFSVLCSVGINYGFSNI